MYATRKLALTSSLLMLFAIVYAESNSIETEKSHLLSPFTVISKTFEDNSISIYQLKKEKHNNSVYKNIL